ncbi:MAG: molybdopterin-dependent oxidoreductase [Chloroflexota bacterium]|nr:molybdopterin-dependent oxidoreductase [Chloroflexota bacterium]
MSGKGSDLNNHHARKVLTILTAGIICLVAAIGVYAWDISSATETIDWELTLTRSNGVQLILSYDEIKAMPSYEGRGGFFTSVGVVNGPYRVKGVPVVALCDAVGGVSPSDIVYVFATDGYSAVFDYEQIMGDMDTYDPETMKLVSHEELKVLLEYEQDGKALSHDYGKPLRLAIAGEESLLTEGHHWVKWINKIEIINID